MVKVTSLLIKVVDMGSVLESELGQKWRCGALNARKYSSEKNLEFKGLLKQLIFRLIQAVICALIIQSILREKQDMI